MSVESAKEFVERLVNDENWRNKINAAETQKERQAMVKEEGFDFSEEELAQCRDELSTSDLDAVTGGGTSGFCRSTNWD